jgi:ribonucleotide monophosphatase NagD (HAD superfamily)
VAAQTGATPSEILFVGDRLYTDYELARNAGCHFALTLTGETRRADLAALSEPPDVVVESLSGLSAHFDFGPA